MDGARSASLEPRIDRLESLDAIRQLPHRYALAVDTRNLDDLVELFVEDVQVGRDRSGRPALRAWFAEALGAVGATVHFVASHVVDLDGADRARGVVTCRDEIDRDGKWLVGCLQYWDEYERRAGRWYFSRRRFHRWYLAEAGTPPRVGMGVGGDGLATGRLPDAWPSWGRFWQERSSRAR